MKQLEGRVAIVYGATGSVGSAVTRSFAEAGARLFLAGRNADALSDRCDELASRGADGQATCLDVYDSRAVAEHAEQVRRDAGRIDVVFNAVTYDDVQGTSLVELDLGVFAQRIQNTVAAQYGVAQAASRVMIEQQAGALLTIVGHGPPHPGLGTTAVSWQLVEGMLRQWAADLGPHGIQVSWLRTTGFRESILGDRDYGSSYADGMEVSALLAEIEASTLTGTVPSVAEAGRAAVYLACTEGLTANAINLTAGATAD